MFLTKEEIDAKAEKFLIGILKKEQSVKDQEVFALFKYMFSNFYNNILRSFAPEGSSLKDYCYIYDEGKNLYASLTVPVNFLKGEIFEASAGARMDGKLDEDFRGILLFQIAQLPPTTSKRKEMSAEDLERFISIIKSLEVSASLVLFYVYFKCIAFMIGLTIDGLVNSSWPIIFKNLKRRGEVCFSKEEILKAITVNDYKLQPESHNTKIGDLFGLVDSGGSFNVTGGYDGLVCLSLGFVSKFSPKDILRSIQGFAIISEFHSIIGLLAAQKQRTLLLQSSSQAKKAKVKLTISKIHIQHNLYGTYYYSKITIAS